MPVQGKDQPRRCPKTGKFISSAGRRRWPWWLTPFIGLGALIWFLVRVIPKPSRATYPCQRVAFPLASGFVVWLFGLLASATAFRKARRAFARARYATAVIFVAISISLIWTVMTTPGQKKAQAHEPIVPNSPIGDAKGIYPGRVAWIHDSNATNWPGSYVGGFTTPPSPHWHEDVCTDQEVVNEMLSDALQALTGRDNDTDAWEAIFRSFNEQMGRGYVGYTSGEKIAIKVNFVLSDNPSTMNKNTYYYDQIDNSPQLTRALLRQLIDVVGVTPGDISIGDPSRIMPNHWYNLVEPNCPGVVYLSRTALGGSGRTAITFDTSAPFYWSDPITSRTAGKTQDYIPTHFAQADYFINFAILKSHNDAGITIGGKNHYGSLRGPIDSGYYSMHYTRVTETPGMGHYRAVVDLLGHPKLGGKTILTLIDGLYAGRSWDSRPIRWDMAPFNGDWPSSIFLSQDRIAIDSVAFDFMDNEWDDIPTSENGYPQMSGADDYLHEAALIPDPCSRVNYDPNNDGGLTESLGVHEHWNNATDKQYSRNLDPVNGKGIELVTEPGPVGDLYTDGVMDLKDFAKFAAAWRSQPGDDNWDAACDLYISGYNVIDEYDLAELCKNLLYPDYVPPAAPNNLVATAGNYQVSLDWDDSNEADLRGYNVYRSETSGSGYSKTGSLVTSSDYLDDTVTHDETYYYVVTAVDTSFNESEFSNEDSATPYDGTAPAAPTALLATAGDGTVSLDWLDNSEGDLDGYNVYRSTTSGSGYVKLNGPLLSNSFYTDNSVTNEITYYYVVTAVDIYSNESGYSSEVSATPSSTGPTIYNFDGITASNTQYNAFACIVDTFPFEGSALNVNSKTEATDLEYINISANNIAEWTTDNAGFLNEIFLWVEMKINEAPEDINQIDLTFNGNTSGSADVTHQIYVLKAGTDWTKNSSWVQVGTDMDIEPGVDTMMSRTISSDFSTYINDANGILTWAVYETTSLEVMNINYLEMAVIEAGDI